MGSRKIWTVVVMLFGDEQRGRSYSSLTIFNEVHHATTWSLATRAGFLFGRPRR